MSLIYYVPFNSDPTLGGFHHVKRFTDLVEASTKIARLLLKHRSFYNRRFAVLVEASAKTVNILTRLESTF